MRADDTFPEVTNSISVTFTIWTLCDQKVCAVFPAVNLVQITRRRKRNPNGQKPSKESNPPITTLLNRESLGALVLFAQI